MLSKSFESPSNLLKKPKVEQIGEYSSYLKMKNEMLQ